MRFPGLSVVLVLFGVFSVFASPVGIVASFVDPTAYRSQSGKVLCEIDPSSKFGAGGARYRVTNDSVELWAGSQEFTLYEAAVSEDGTVCGFAYTHGWLGITPKESRRSKVDSILTDFDRRNFGSLVIAAINPKGRVLFKKLYPRSIRWSDPDTSPSIPWPEASLVKLNEEKSAFSMMIHGRPSNAKSLFEISTFKLSSGEELEANNEIPDWRSWRDIHEIKGERWRDDRNDPVLKVPTIDLKLLKRVQLKSDGSSASTVQNTSAMAFNDNGDLALVRAGEEKTYKLTFLRSDGTLINEVPIELSKEETEPVQIAWLKEDKWALTSSTVIYFSNRSLLRVVNAKAGTVERLPDLKGARPTRIRTTQNGLATITMGQGANRMGWNVDYYPQLTNNIVNIDQTQSPEMTRGNWEEADQIVDCVIASENEMIVLHRKPISVVHKTFNGGLLKSNSLETLWPRNFEPYRIARKTNGLISVLGMAKSNFRTEKAEFVISSFKDDSAVVINRFEPHFPDGRAFKAYFAEFAPTGEVWACDGSVVAHLDDRGEVVSIPGSTPAANRLNRIAAATIDSGGKIYVVDSDSGEVHVFNSSGERLRILKPKEPEQNRNAQSISVADSGAIFITGHRLPPSTVAIDPKTEEVKSLTFDLDEQEKSVCALPGDRLLALTYQGGGIFDGTAKLLSAVDRQADRKWLAIPSACAVARDGTIAISSSPNWDLYRISLYSGQGEPLRTFPSIYSRSMALMSDYIVVDGVDEILFMNREGKPLFKASVGRRSDRGIFAMNDDTELWVFRSQDMIIEKYSMPKGTTPWAK